MKWVLGKALCVRYMTQKQLAEKWTRYMEQKWRARNSEGNMYTVGKENMNIVGTVWNIHVPGKTTPAWVLSFLIPKAIGWPCKIHLQCLQLFGYLSLPHIKEIY